MSSLVDYIFVKSLDKCVVIIIDLMSSSRISIEFMMRNTILALDDLCYHLPLYCLPTNTSLFVFGVIPWVPCYPAIVLLYLGTLTSLMSSMLWEFYHLLRILGMVILLTITILSWVLMLVPTGVPTSERCCSDSALLATLLLWGEWAIVHSKSFYNWITILTLAMQPNPYFGRIFQPMLNCVCFPRAYILI